MKRWTTVLFFAMSAAVCVFLIWSKVTQFYTTDLVDVILLFVLYGFGNVGLFWMLYVVIRYEKRPFPFVLLAFIPYAFVWYYFERYRPGKHLTRRAQAE
jgi:hypothetical protein